VALGVGVGVLVGVGVGVLDGVGVGVGVGVCAGVAAGVADVDSVGDGVTSGVADAVCEGVGVTFTTTPLFQTNFLPDFTQVYFLPLYICVAFNFVHVAPGFGVFAADATG
jgi:hypothetical protein